MLNRQASTSASYRWVILIAVFFVQGIVSMASFSFGPLAPFLIETFHITRAQVGMFSSLISLTLALFAMPAGWLVDRFGVRWLLLLGAGAFGLLYALFSQVPNVIIGYAVIFIAGLGYVFVPQTTTMALVHWFPPNERATAVSIKQSGLTVGTAIGAVLIPSLALLAGWRSAAAYLGIGVVALVVLSWAIYRERVTAAPVMRVPALNTFRETICNRALLRLGLVGAIYLALQMGAISYLVLQLVEVRGMSVVLAGTFLMATNIGGAVGRILFGFLSDRVFGGKRGHVLALAGVISGATAILLSATIATTSLPLLYLAVIVFGFTGLGWNGVLLAFASEVSGKSSAATGLGWALTILNVGGIAGPPLFGYIVDRTASYSPAWLLFGIAVILAALWIWGIKGQESKQPI